MVTKYYKKVDKCCKKKRVKTIKIFLKKKTKSVSMLVIDIENFL